MSASIDSTQGLRFPVGAVVTVPMTSSSVSTS